MADIIRAGPVRRTAAGTITGRMVATGGIVSTSPCTRAPKTVDPIIESDVAGDDGGFRPAADHVRDGRDATAVVGIDLRYFVEGGLAGHFRVSAAWDSFCILGDTNAENRKN
jgi:hypothetical protein